MPNRRSFLRQLSIGGALLCTGQFPFGSLAASHAVNKLTILHTNDTHSHLDPFPDTAVSFAGLGGAEARADLIAQIREQEQHVLLLDAGDFWQGTPYFDLYKGAPEILAMNQMGYDAVTLGARDLDTGTDNLATQLALARFPVLGTNYKTDHPVLARQLSPFTVVPKSGMRIGIIGIGAALRDDAGGIATQVSYSDPVSTALTTAATLKKHHNCDMVICLSRLGLNEYYYQQLNDRVLARETEHIDLIIGGQSHTFLDKPLMVKNKKGKEVLIAQAGWGGVKMGRLDFIFSDKKKILSANAQTVIIRK